MLKVFPGTEPGLTIQRVAADSVQVKKNIDYPSGKDFLCRVAPYLQLEDHKQRGNSNGLDNTHVDIDIF